MRRLQLWLSHVDVVPAGDGWETDPFVMTKIGNQYFGRGVADDKGAAIVSLYCLKVLQDEQVPTKRRIRTIFGAGEETGSDDLERYFEKEPMPVMGFTPDSEYGVWQPGEGYPAHEFLCAERFYGVEKLYRRDCGQCGAGRRLCGVGLYQR